MYLSAHSQQYDRTASNMRRAAHWQRSRDSSFSAPMHPWTCTCTCDMRTCHMHVQMRAADPTRTPLNGQPTNPHSPPRPASSPPAPHRHARTT
eukprot:6608218-Prymnesium_polylepis.2